MMSVMIDSIDLTIDVTEAAGLGEPLSTKATVTLPDPATIGAPPVVCFAFPGGGYGRRYFTFDMPDGSGGGQAGWHARRGWIFVSCDHLLVGESSAPSQPEQLTFGVVAAANAATVAGVTAALTTGTLADGFPPVDDARLLGIGQSMGGCFTIVQQGLLGTFAGVGVLGFSALQTMLAFPPDAEIGDDIFAARADGLPVTTWGFHYDDEPPDMVAEDMRDYPTRGGRLPVWASATVPPCATLMLNPGCVAAEAAAITVPVFVGVGERDVCPDPRAEPQAYEQSSDITVYVCPRMSHMHNFASTREQFWARLHSWGERVASSP
jgi:pimeloyl-ACP methyl ester carboxylesterase